jgi:hypothetical protein
MISIRKEAQNKKCFPVPNVEEEHMVAQKTDTFEIRSYTWDRNSPQCKELFQSYLKTTPGSAATFCDIYFERFYLLHKLGHIVLHRNDREHMSHPARTEHLANLFALKYFQEKGEDEYLERLRECINYVLSVYSVRIDFDCDKFDPIYPKYTHDFRTYAAISFSSLKKCYDDDSSFKQVLSRASCGNLNQTHPGIILRKDLKGQELIDECLSYVFELSGDVPEVKLSYEYTLALDKLDLVLN